MVDALEATLDAVADGVLLLDEAGRIAEVNRAATDLLGRSRHDIVGRSLESLIPEILKSALEPAATTPRLAAGSRVEILAHRHDGSMVPLEITLGESQAQGRTVIVVLLHDLSEHQRHERNSHRQRERLAAALLTATLGEAASALTHEINQPLAAIANYAQACRHMVEKDPSRHASMLSILEKIGAQAQRAGEELRRFRRLVDHRAAGGEPESMERIDLNDLMREIVELTELESCDEEQTIDLDLGDELPLVAGQRLELQAAILGLVRNALADTLDSHRSALVRARRAGDRDVELTIAGAGEAAARHDEGELASPFLNTLHGSIWMGTAVARSILTAQGGRLDVDRDPAGRTTYRITLPQTH